MTCKQLGGACDLKFHAETFDDIAEQSKKHGMDMYQAGDQPHLAAIKKMQEFMKPSEAMNKWFENKKKEFEALPND